MQYKVPVNDHNYKIKFAPKFEELNRCHKTIGGFELKRSNSAFMEEIEKKARAIPEPSKYSQHRLWKEKEKDWDYTSHKFGK